MSSSQVAKLVAVLLGAYPSARDNAGTSMAYERMLADLDFVAASAAVEKLIASSRFMPSIAEIRETTLALTDGEVHPGGEAWGSVLRAIGSAGAYRVPGVDFEFSDPVTARCVQALGWTELCSSECQAADRARFIELYDTLSVQERRKALSHELPAMERFVALERSKVRELEDRTGETSTGDALCKVLTLVTEKP